MEFYTPISKDLVQDRARDLARRFVDSFLNKIQPEEWYRLSEEKQETSLWVSRKKIFHLMNGALRTDPLGRYSPQIEVRHIFFREILRDLREFARDFNCPRSFKVFP